MDASEAGTSRRRSRRLRALALVVLVLGASTPIRLAVEWASIWPTMKFLGLERYGFSFVVSAAVTLALGVLGACAGWGLFQRASWAPLMSCVAGGAILVDSGAWLQGLLAPSLIVIVRSWTPKYFRVVLTMGVPVLVELTLFVSWALVVLTVLKRKGREGFGSEQSGIPASTLWFALGLSAGLCGLLTLLQRVMWDATPDGR